MNGGLSLQRHFNALTKFAHVESRFCGRKRRGKAAFDVPLNPCSRSVCSRSVAVGLLLTDRNSIVLPTKSIITHREAIIYGISYELNARYIYNDEGNFQRNYSPDPNRSNNERIKKLIIEGIKIYRDLKEVGFDDKTLKDTLGIAWASLSYDKGVPDLIPGVIGNLGSYQIYLDALKATLLSLNTKKDHSSNFLEELSSEMKSRELTADDIIL